MAVSRAFSLLEAAVVMFLIGLAALTVTAAFGGQRSESQDRIAQTDIDAALDATSAIASIDGLVSADLTRLGAEAPELVFKAANEQPAGPGQVSVAVSSADSIVGVAARTADGTCWYARHSLEARSSQRVRIFAVAPPGATQPCTGTLAANLDVFSPAATDGGTWRTPLALSDQYAPTTIPSSTPATLPPVTTLPGGSTSSTTTPPATTTATTVATPATTPAGSPPTPPGAPTGVVAAVVPTAPTTATITWLPPASAGSSPVTGYAVSCTATGGSPVSGTSASSPSTLGSFSPGYSYTCAVRALNAVGYGEWSAPSAAFTPFNLPPTPTGFALAPADASIIASWTPITSTPATPVAGYRVYRSGVLACQVVGADARTCVVGGLTNGTSYSLQVTSYHLSSESAPTAPLSATPSGAPGAPTIGTATPGVSAGSPSVDVSFTPPATSGGSPITTYTVTCRSSNGGEPAAATGTTGPLTVLPLTPGRTYTCDVAAANAAGNGPASAPTASFAAVNVPDAPSDLGATAQGATITVSFTPGAANGATVSTYRVTCTPATGNPLTATAGSSPVSLSGGIAGTAYTCTAAARNTLGWGEESTPSAPVTPFGAPATPPVGLSVTPANSALDVSWTPIVSTMQAPVVGYRVYVDGVIRCTITDASIDACQAAGLANGVTYPVFITAYNAAGESPPSATLYGTPVGLPGVPSGLVAVLAGDGSGRIAVFFVAPSSNGGAPVTDYDVQWSSNGGASWTTFDDGVSALPSVTVDGLTDGTAYVFHVRARNASGAGEWSETSNAVTASDVPGAVTNVQVAAGQRQITATWTPAASRTTSPITGHEVQYRTATGAWSPEMPLDTASSDPEYLIENLTNGQAYAVRVRAYNTAGPGPWAQSAQTATPYALPVIGALTLTPGDGELVASWARPTGVFDGYRVYVATSGSSLDQLGCQTTSAATTTCTITGLTNGQAYDAAVSVYRFGTDGDTSPPATATPVGPPGTPSDLVAAAGSSNVSASWAPVTATAAAPVTGYRVYYATGTATPTLGCTAVGSTSCTVSGLTPGVLYGIQVTTYGPGGESAPSPAQFATPSGTSDAPSIASISAGNAQVDVAWAPSPTPTGTVVGYVVLRDGTTGCTTPDAATTTCSVTGLTNGTLYSFQVYALYASSTSAVSSAVEATPVQPATVSYQPVVLDPLRNDQTYSPTTSGFATTPSFSLSGAAPAGVGFSTVDGVFRGPATWSGRAAALSSGVSSAHACFVTFAGAVKCWGNNGSRQLGDATSYNRAAPVDTQISSGASAVAVSMFSTCVLTTAGGVKCWGNNSYGQYGNGTTMTSALPQDVSGLSTGVTRITGQWYSFCAVHAGSVKCWGANTNGMLGDGTTTNRTTPVTVTGIIDAVDVAVGSNFACALSSTSGVSCWGANSSGQLGNGTTTASTTPVPVTGLSTGVTMIAAGEQHACALLATGGVKCWGSNGNGRLGDGSTSNRSTPVSVLGVDNASQLSLGSSHSCVSTTAGAARCWGYNLNGRLGDGTTSDRATPVTVNGLAAGVRAVAASGSHTCALTTSATVKCWGQNEEGELGVGWHAYATAPAAVSGVTNASKVVTALGHSCVLNTLGGVKCWGSNSNGALGAGNVASVEASPQQVVGLASGVAGITASQTTTCALTTAGGVKCWGGSAGTLGNGSMSTSNVPVDVTGLTSGATQVVSGMNFVCALTTAGGVKCWGTNGFGQLGDGTTTTRTTPVDVTGLTAGVTQITAGTYHACALLAAGTIRCWGLNESGALGGTGLSSSYPASAYTTPQNVTQVTSNIASVWAGHSSTCSISTAGALRCWGDNLYGQSNYATLSSGVVAVHSGMQGRCALMTDTSVRCWGLNERGQLGDLTIVNRTSPVTPDGLGTGVAALASGVHDSRCAVMIDGTLRCWGESYYGEIGHSYNPRSLVPVEQPMSAETAVDAVSGTAHTCVLLSTSGVRCFGANADGQLGDGTTTASLTGVTPFGLSSGVRQLTAGAYHTCAAMLSGGTKCWGRNTNGQLGDNSTTRRTTPVDVSGLTTQVARVAAGTSHTCAVLTSTAVRCWGANGSGQLGNGTTTQALTAVTPTGLTTGAVLLASGGSHTCITTLTATVRCWGENTNGQLGDGSTSASTTPVNVTGVANVAQVVAGAAHTCTRSAGSVACWGQNASGQLGNGSTTASPTPVSVPGVSDVADLVATSASTCAVSAGASAPRCWGSLVTATTGATSVVSSPSDIAGFSGVTGIGSGAAAVHACATTPGGMLGCFGQNGSGQLGDTTVAGRPAAVWARGLVTNTGFPSDATVTATDTTRTASTQVSFSLGTVANEGTGSPTTTTPAATTTTTTTTIPATATTFAPTSTAPVSTTTTTTTVPLTAPTAPTGVLAVVDTASPLSATVSFNTPSSTGGAPITLYRATCTSSNGGTTRTQTGASSPITVTALTAAKSYTCTVAAQNSVGWSPESAPSAAIAPYTTPGAPSAASASPTFTGSPSAEVSFDPPASDGGSPVTGYGVTCISSNGGTLGTASGPASPITVEALTPMKSYTCSVAAMNAAGTGASSAVSNPFDTFTTPDAPTGVSATLSAQTPTSATVSFTTPASDGGWAIDFYDATCTSPDGGTTRTATGGASPLVVTGLSAGKTYTCTVSAENIAGNGPLSAPSTSFVSYNIPGTPSGLTATPGNTSVTLSWTAMSSTTESPVSGYRVYRSGTLACTAAPASATTCSATGLTNGTAYSFQVVAYYDSYEGVLSAAVTATPIGAPGAPQVTAASASAAAVTLTFQTGSSNGSAITGHTATCTSGNGGTTRTASGTASPLTVSSLTAGATYACSVTSTNGVGTSAASNAATVSSQISSYDCPSGGSHIGGGTCQQTQYNYDWTCPSGGSLSGTTCVNGYTASDSYGASVLACWNATYLDATGTNWVNVSYPRILNSGGYNACGAHIGYNEHRTKFNGCWGSAALAAAFGDAVIGCRTDRFVNVRRFRGGGTSYHCPSGGSLSGTTCNRSWWVDTSYAASWTHVSTSYPTYAGTPVWQYSATL